MHFDLESLYGQKPDASIFENLELPFTEEEVNVVVKELPLDKSPGPDGFNNEFFKSCWDIIKEDLLRLIYDFHVGKLLLESINTSYITLIPKGSIPLQQIIISQFLSSTTVSNSSQSCWQQIWPWYILVLDRCQIRQDSSFSREFQITKGHARPGPSLHY